MIDALVPPPVLVRRRAWEAALMLCQDFRHRMAQHEREHMAWLVALGPDRLTWEQTGAALRLYRSHVPVRQ